MTKRELIDALANVADDEQVKILLEEKRTSSGMYIHTCPIEQVGVIAPLPQTGRYAYLKPAR